MPRIWRWLGKPPVNRSMPEVSRFYGIIIRFYYREHPPEHFALVRSTGLTLSPSALADSGSCHLW